MKMKNAGRPLFFKSLALARSNPGKIGLMMLFDASFFVSFYYITPLLGKSFAQSLVVSNTSLIILMIAVFSLLYALLVVLIYSFFKYCLLDFIKSMFAKTEFSFKRLWNFYLLNVVIMLPSFVLFNFLLSSIKEAYRPYALILFGIPVSILLYVIINTAHSLFYNGHSFKESIRKSFAAAFADITPYKETILVILIAAILLFVVFFGIGYLVNFLASKNYYLYLRVYSYFANISLLIQFLAFYFVILLNRISFYAITLEKNFKK